MRCDGCDEVTFDGRLICFDPAAKYLTRATFFVCPDCAARSLRNGAYEDGESND